ncbi:MAG TPA: DoxX family protein [Casimicrobiaceae bacterium]|nr:DoxX family protein [Casimicrobiaceae bacterium]
MSESDRIAVAALLTRTGLGVMFIAHALQKLFVFTIPGTVQFFQSVGFPGALAYVTIAAELVGGALLVLGVKARAVALALIPLLLGAAWVHHGNGWVFNAPNGGWEYPVFLILVAIVVALLPQERYSVMAQRSDRRTLARA